MRISPTVARSIGASLLVVSMPTTLRAQILTPPPNRTTVTVMSNGPAPTGASVTGTPTVATVNWQPVSGAVRYVVQRGKDGDATCCNAASGDITAATWTDNAGGTGIQWSGTYTYTITAWQADGHYGQASVKWTRPEPVNPSGFAAKQTGEGVAELSWQAVPNASYYWIWGPGTGASGVRADGTTKTFTGLGAGAQEWSITTRYDPAGVLLASSTWPKAQLNMVTRTGMYRITLNGFEMSQPVDENRFNPDGTGNEVLALAYVRAFDRASGRLLNEGSMETAVHGDTEGFQGRIPAGTAKSTGGLVAGNKFPSTTPWVRGNSVSSTTFPLLLWEGALTDGGEAIVVTPTIWEWQSADRSKIESMLGDLRANTPNVWPTVAAALGTAQSWGGPKQINLNEWVNTIVANTYIFDTPRTHPVGGTLNLPAERKWYYIPHVGVVFTRELVEAALSGQSTVGAYGPGVISVRWVDKANTGGAFILYLQVARQ